MHRVHMSAAMEDVTVDAVATREHMTAPTPTTNVPAPHGRHASALAS